MRLRSEQIVTPAISAELVRIKPAITEIREHLRMRKTAAVLFPMDSLKFCAFALPRTPQSQITLQSAMKLAKNLEYLQMYAQTENTSRLVLRLIGMLPDLPQVSSLQIVTGGCATCLACIACQGQQSSAAMRHGKIAALVEQPGERKRDIDSCRESVAAMGSRVSNAPPCSACDCTAFLPWRAVCRVHIPTSMTQSEREGLYVDAIPIALHDHHR